MAAEAVHLSALADGLALPGLPGGLRALLSMGGETRGLELARLGAVFVDLPYFDRFPLKAALYAVGRTQPPSAWGDAFHQERPVAVGTAMLAEARALREAGDRLRADRLDALALGYFSHLAVDYATHGLINQMAEARAKRRGAASAHHHEIEKYQSVLFHEQRNGFDFMGTPLLPRYVRVEHELLVGDVPLTAALLRAIDRALGKAPTAAELARFLRGYRQYGWILGSPAGKRLAPAAGKERERPRVFATPGFHYLDLFTTAVRRVGRYLEAAWAVREGAPLDPVAVPEGSIDHPPLEPP